MALKSNISLSGGQVPR